MVHGKAQHNQRGMSLRRNAAFISFSLCSSNLKENYELWPSLASVESEGVQHFLSSLQVPWHSLKLKACKGTHTALAGSVGIGSDLFH